tara:strand:+ start:1733 stop:1939 length:207 start_codon:yes stop_codon:yes gene_type:complete
MKRAKQTARDKLARDTEAFLASGGKITQLPSDHRGFDNEIIFFLGREKHERTKRTKRKASGKAKAGAG